MARPIKSEARRPNCLHWRGQRVRIDRHESMEGLCYTDWLGSVTFSTAIFGNTRSKIYEQVTVELDKGPTIIFKVRPDVLSNYDYCGVCAQRNRRCTCAGRLACGACGNNDDHCVCCGECGERFCICE